jgi:hypothetical protein
LWDSAATGRVGFWVERAFVEKPGDVFCTAASGFPPAVACADISLFDLKGGTVEGVLTSVWVVERNTRGLLKILEFVEKNQLSPLEEEEFFWWEGVFHDDPRN